MLRGGCGTPVLAATSQRLPLLYEESCTRARQRWSRAGSQPRPSSASTEAISPPPPCSSSAAVGVPLPARLGQSPVPVEVAAVGREVPMHLAVVLGDPTRAHQPEVGARDEAPRSVVDDALRLHLDVRGAVQHPHDRLPRRLAAGVEQRDDRTQPWSPRRRTPAAACSSSSVQSPHRRAESPSATRSSTPRSHAVASSVSAAVATRSPRTSSIAGGAASRVTAKPRRCGWRSSSPTAARTGLDAGAGSHQPRSSAAVRWVNTAESGSTWLHARSRSAKPWAAVGTCRPCPSRTQPGPRRLVPTSLIRGVCAAQPQQ